MSNQKIGIEVNKQKKIIIFFLYMATVIIMFLGAFFGAFSVINNIYMKVLNMSIPGVVFGVLVVYLGLRYYLMVSDFKTGFYKNTEKFSWSNFKKDKNKNKISGTKKLKLVSGR